jgi:hypothetical protein
VEQLVAKRALGGPKLALGLQGRLQGFDGLPQDLGRGNVPTDVGGVHREAGAPLRLALGPLPSPGQGQPALDPLWRASAPRSNRRECDNPSVVTDEALRCPHVAGCAKAHTASVGLHWFRVSLGDTGYVADPA